MPRRDQSDVNDDDDLDDGPRRRSRRDDLDGRAGAKPGLAVTAAVLWLVWAGVLFLALLIRAASLVNDVAAQKGVNEVCGGADLLILLGAAVCSGLMGLVTILGQTRSLVGLGVISMLLPPAVVILETVVSFFMGLELARGLDRGRNDLPFTMAIRGFVVSTALVSGVFVAGIFALFANKQYRTWRWRRERRGR